LGTLRPNLPKASSGPFPRAMPDGACGATVGLYSRRSRTEAAFTGLRPAPHPVAALGLSVALGRDPAVAPTPHAPAVNRYVGRVTSLEKLYPDVWLTFNALCKQNRGWIEFRQGANNPSPGVPCSLSRKPQVRHRPGVFAIWDCETCSHLTTRIWANRDSAHRARLQSPALDPSAGRSSLMAALWPSPDPQRQPQRLMPRSTSRSRLRSMSRSRA